MKAILFDTIGSSAVLKTREISTPIPKSDEVLIKIAYASVNPVDWKIREGTLQDLLPYKFPITPGWDASGEIIAIGKNVKNFAIGDFVYAFARFSEIHIGTYAEFITLPESFVAKKPSHLDLQTAAAVPLTALTAYQVLHESARIKQNDKVLITAGAGGVGTFAIQFAKLAGANVTATASAKNFAYLQKMGATHMIDYTTQSLTDVAYNIAPNGYDVVFDCVGGDTLAEATRLVKKTGQLVSIVEMPQNGHFHFVYPNGKQLEKIAELFDSNQLIPPDIKTMNIKHAGIAQDENMQRHICGKIVLEISF